MDSLRKENEKLRELLRRARWKLWTSPGDTLRAEIEAALSQQAEPKCSTCNDVGIIGHSDICPECADTWTQLAEPAPAQDEREAFEAWRLEKFCGGTERLRKCSNAPDVYYFTAEQEAWKVWQARAALTASPAQTGQQPAAEPTTALDERAIRLLAELSRAPQEGEKVSRDRMSAIIEVGHDRAAFSARLARRAQTEQQPVAWVEVKDRHEGPYEFHGIELLDSGKHDLFTTPVAQAAPQPEQSGLYTCIGKGGVYELIGRATTAGVLKVTGRFADEVIVYRDTESNALYCREPGDFRLRTARAALAAQGGAEK